jgi:hypothetical protein
LEYLLADDPHIGFRTSGHRRSPACAGGVRPPLDVASEPSILSLASREVMMFRDKETRFLEAGLLAAVPICVAITALIALLTLVRI